jgi:hypothetical protein
MKMGMEHMWNDTDRGKQKNLKKTLSRANLPTTNLTWNDLGSSSGLLGEKPTTNHLQNELHLET